MSESRLTGPCPLGVEETVEVAERMNAVSAMRERAPPAGGADVVSVAVGLSELWEQSLHRWSSSVGTSRS